MTVPAANGTRRDGHAVVEEVAGTCFPCVGLGKYCTSCVFLGVWDVGLAGEPEFDLETTTGGVGFLFVRI